MYSLYSYQIIGFLWRVDRCNFLLEDFMALMAESDLNSEGSPSTSSSTKARPILLHLPSGRFGSIPQSAHSVESKSDSLLECQFLRQMSRLHLPHLLNSAQSARGLDWPEVDITKPICQKRHLGLLIPLWFGGYNTCNPSIHASS